MKLIFPEKVLEQHAVVLGKTGAGKSSALRHVVEHLLARNRRVCVIDPKGDWWGLKVSGDGRGEGFPVITFGDFKEPKAADVPINAQSGKTIAELIVSGNRPAVIGLRGWMPSAQSKFWIDFASTVFNSNSAGGLHLVIDEVQNFGPKERAGFGDENMALHWSKRLLSEGRGLGLSIFVGSQRPQSVHNGVLTQCATLVAMSVVHDADCQAVENWLRRTRDKEKRAEIMSTIPELARGEAWFWSPDIGYGPERVKFPMFETFDSFAPPQKQKRINRKTWAGVDLSAVKDKLSAVIEEHKANDPAELRKQISEFGKEERLYAARIAKLENELVEWHNRGVKENGKVKEVPTLDRKQTRQLVYLVEYAKCIKSSTANFMRDAAELRRQVEDLMSGVLKLNSTIRAPSDAAALEAAKPALMQKIKTILSGPAQTATAASLTNTLAISGNRATLQIHNGELTGGMRLILVSAAQYPGGVTDDQLAVLTGYKATSRKVYKGKLIASGYLTKRGGNYVATEAGISALGNFERLPTGSALRDYWLQRLTGGEVELLKVYCANYPTEVETPELMSATNYKQTSIKVYRQKLRARKLVIGDAASKELFE